MSFEPGEYDVGETWDLYVGGELRNVHVDHVKVHECDEPHRYHVDHYDPAGQHVTRVSVDERDLTEVLGGGHSAT